MNKKLLTLVMVVVASLSIMTGCSSNDPKPSSKPESTPSSSSAAPSGEKPTEEYQFVSPEDALKATGVHVLDVREWKNYSEGRVKNTLWCPIFPLDDESLADAMKDYAAANLNDGKDIYIICNSGNKGAQKTTAVLKEAGFDSSKIFTVEGGAKALGEIKDALTTNRTEENIEWKYAKAADVLADAEAQIVDVRDEGAYADGHLKNSYNVSLKEIEDTKAQTALYDLALEKLDKTKPVYFLCYSGNKCAKTGVSVLRDAGFDLENLLIIENGAKDADIAAAFTKE